MTHNPQGGKLLILGAIHQLHPHHLGHQQQHLLLQLPMCHLDQRQLVLFQLLHIPLDLPDSIPLVPVDSTHLDLRDSIPLGPLDSTSLDLQDSIPPGPVDSTRLDLPDSIPPGPVDSTRLDLPDSIPLDLVDSTRLDLPDSIPLDPVDSIPLGLLDHSPLHPVGSTPLHPVGSNPLALILQHLQVLQEPIQPLQLPLVVVYIPLRLGHLLPLLGHIPHQMFLSLLPLQLLGHGEPCRLGPMGHQWEGNIQHQTCHILTRGRTLNQVGLDPQFHGDLFHREHGVLQHQVPFLLLRDPIQTQGSILLLILSLQALHQAKVTINIKFWRGHEVAFHLYPLLVIIYHLLGSNCRLQSSARSMFEVFFL
ncbi:uncharacterized protein [Ambystoma mexicanum]|uniref:uncharacterized protein n=1 Tax=Ambystoma mexicanum TaxID=8296 RepID=UPI0037E88708